VRRLCRVLVVCSLCVLFGVAVPVPVEASPVRAPCVQGTVVHVVQPGENLFRISLRYRTTVEAIASANGLSANTIYAGQRLLIPTVSASSTEAWDTDRTGATYVVEWGDTLSRIAVDYGVSLRSLAEANGLSGTYTIYAGQILVIPRASGSTGGSSVATAGSHVVKPGETLDSIARLYSTTVSELANLNGIANPSRIYAGQVLRLSSATPAVPSGSAKRIVVNLSQQRLYAYLGGQLVYNFVISSGAAPYLTRTGSFRVESKFPSAYGSLWDIWMPYWMGLYWAGSTENGIHALPVLSNGQTLWAGYLGHPVSYGCIVVGTYEAKLLYDWTPIGTPVTITY